MMLAVGDSPGVEGNEEEGVHDQSHGPVQLLALGESSMSTFVCQNPDTGEDETLNGGVGNPGSEAEVWVGEEWNVGDGEVDEGREVEEVADDVGHAAEGGWFEAMSWDGIVNLLHGVIWQDEGIAIEIHMLGFRRRHCLRHGSGGSHDLGGCN